MDNNELEKDSKAEKKKRSPIISVDVKALKDKAAQAGGFINDKARGAAESLGNVKLVDKDGNTILDMSQVKDKAQEAGDYLSEKAAAVKDAALETKEEIDNKLNELDNMLAQAVTDYNDAYTLMNDKGISLYVERCRAVDVITNIEALINSVANHPKTFDTEFEEINITKKHFIDSCEFAAREVKVAREAASGAGASLAAGATAAFLAPNAAMWVATTFGTTSTGVAISTLSGAAAQNAALAWLGGGALATGGGGMAAGSKALLAIGGTLGWGIAGVSIASTILVISAKKMKLNKQKNEEIEALKTNTEAVREADYEIGELFKQTNSIMEGLKGSYIECLTCFGKDYNEFTEAQKKKLGVLVNNTKALSASLDKTVA